MAHLHPRLLSRRRWAGAVFRTDHSVKRDDDAALAVRVFRPVEKSPEDRDLHHKDPPRK